MTETFRLRETVKYRGVLSTLLFLAISVGTCLPFIVGLPDTDGSPLGMAAFGCAVFGSMTLLAAYVWRAYYVEFVTIDDSGVTIRSMMQNCRFDFAEPLDMRCRTAPIGGSILLRSCEHKARLELYGYSTTQRLRIIQRLRRLVPLDRQIGWPEFCRDIALFLRENKPTPVLFAKPSEVIVIKRSRYDQMLAYGLPLAIVVAVTASFLWDLREMLIIPIPIIFGWLMLRPSVPPSGRQMTRLASKLEGKIALSFLGGPRVLYSHGCITIPYSLWY